MGFEKVRHIDLPKICDPRGNLSFLENGGVVPFPIARTYWVYDVPGGKKRFGHAFHRQEELIISLSGSFDIVLNDGSEERRYHMARSYYGLYVPRMMWRELDNFSTNSVALILASTPYDASDYIEDFNLYHHENGNLTVVENGKDFPFEVQRVFYIYDVPGGTDRGGHSHRRCHQFIVAVSGSFDLEIDDGVSRRTVTLNRSNIGLYVAPGIWVGLRNFSSGSVCLTLASDPYDEADYVRDYDEFLNLTANKRK